MISNQIFPFFTIAHRHLVTTKWCQYQYWLPCCNRKSNKKHHQAAAVSTRTPVVQYHNEILSNELTMFCLREHEEWEWTGLFPFNPLCKAWTTIIVTLGTITEKQKESHQAAISYKVWAKCDSITALTMEERKTLHEDLDLGEPSNNLGDLYVQVSSVLARWRGDFEKAVEEGNDCEEYSCIWKPGPKTEAERLVLTLVEFFHPERAETIDLAQMQNEEISNNVCEGMVQICMGLCLVMATP